MVSQKKIDEIVEKHASVFRALEKFENTGRVILKSRMNFTIDRVVARQFRDHCKKNRYNMSEIIEKFMRKIV